MNIHDFNRIGRRIQQDSSIPVELTAHFPLHIDGVLLRVTAAVRLVGVKAKEGQACPACPLMFMFNKVLSGDYSAEATTFMFKELVLACQDKFDAAKKSKQLTTEKETWTFDGEEFDVGSTLFEFEDIEWIPWMAKNEVRSGIEAQEAARQRMQLYKRSRRQEFLMSKIALPPDLKESIDLYVEQGLPTGSFLQACIENDLREAVGHADERNICWLVEIVQYLYWECPHQCYGKKGVFERWIKAGGLQGVAK